MGIVILYGLAMAELGDAELVALRDLLEAHTTARRARFAAIEVTVILYDMRTLNEVARATVTPLSALVPALERQSGKCIEVIFDWREPLGPGWPFADEYSRGPDWLYESVNEARFVQGATFRLYGLVDGPPP